MSTLKPWPADNGMPRFDELIGPVRAVIDQGYDLTRKEGAALSYDGYTIGVREQAVCFEPDVAIQPEVLERRAEDGQDLLDVMLTIAFQLGMEQGRRSAGRYIFFPPASSKAALARIRMRALVLMIQDRLADGHFLHGPAMELRGIAEGLCAGRLEATGYLPKLPTPMSAFDFLDAVKSLVRPS